MTLKIITMKIKTLIIAIICLFFSPNSIYGQINLGTAENFVMFTAAGAFDNVGESHFIGDIGTNVGAITGFPPGTVTGQIHQANPTSLQAAADVETAYNYLTGVPCDSVIGNALGSNQILTPYVYCILTAASLTGELVLDGENDPNALFIIKITGVLDLIGLSKITLINSATANNVYWQIDGAVNIGDSAVFNGTILANGALSFVIGAVLNGHGLSRQGAISTISMNATISNDYSMPVELIDFKGENMLTYNLLSWSTVSEINNNYFTIERSIDGTHFTEVKTLSGEGTSSTTLNYSFSDYEFEKKINYYRLTQTDYDGASETFDLISINNLKDPYTITKVVNMLGQEMDKDYLGFRIIYFSNGESVKVHGKYIPNP
jgi:hypothetical protein